MTTPSNPMPSSSAAAAPRFVALAGGVGGAKLAHGLAALLPPDQLTIIVNTGDDMEYLGLKVCPDMDTVLYTLGGVANPATGWGRADDTFACLQTLHSLGQTDWFKLGDRDLATHLLRTHWLREGKTLSQATAALAQALGIPHPILPMCDTPCPTLLETDAGVLDFQSYFVKHQCQPVIRRIFWQPEQPAHPTPAVLQALQNADCVIFCPSNPFVSIDPILSLPGIRDLIATRFCMALSPIIQGKALKGPAAKMFSELGMPPSASAVARYYQDLLDVFFLDQIDQSEMPAVESLGIACQAIPSLLPTLQERRQTADLMLQYYMNTQP